MDTGSPNSRCRTLKQSAIVVVGETGSLLHSGREEVDVGRMTENGINVCPGLMRSYSLSIESRRPSLSKAASAI